jgi:phosphoribosyl-dephospho-CoA transferase
MSPLVKENVKFKNLLTQNIEEIRGTMERSNLRIIERRKRNQGQGHRKYFQQNYRRKLPLKKKKKERDH